MAGETRTRARARYKRALKILHDFQHLLDPDDLTGKQRMELFNMRLRLERKLKNI